MPKNTLADVIVGFPLKGITKSDEHGMERWDFRVRSENYGELVCSFYPHLAEHSFCEYFTRLMTGASEADVIEAMLTFNKEHPGTLQDQVSRAMWVLEANLPDIMEQAIVLAGQIAIDRAIHQGAGKSHRLGKAKASDGSEQLNNTALKIVRAYVTDWDFLAGPPASHPVLGIPCL